MDESNLWKEGREESIRHWPALTGGSDFPGPRRANERLPHDETQVKGKCSSKSSSVSAKKKNRQIKEETHQVSDRRMQICIFFPPSKHEFVTFFEGLPIAIYTLIIYPASENLVTATLPLRSRRVGSERLRPNRRKSKHLQKSTRPPHLISESYIRSNYAQTSPVVHTHTHAQLKIN